DLWTHMENQVGSHSEECYLNSEDRKKLIAETVSNLIVQSTTDSGYVEKGDELSVEKAIESVLTERQVSTEHFTPQQWKSVFWDPKFAQPDKVTQLLNKVYIKDSNDDDSFSVNKESGTIAAEAKIGIPLPAGILGRNIDIGASGSHENAQKVSVKRVQNYLRENHNYVKWNGQKFVTKPMQGSVSFITS
ncbi:uncharacterized protein LOC142356880, partial [Convolutriloba macropyga]|uniref:uncharacterized protein LOC142356880 n=1 Tax=Convolutriloba macropyga TaxID=536237 RepID=UPI003F51E806